MTVKNKGCFEIEDREAVLIVRVDGGPHAVFGLEIANQLEELVNRVDDDPRVHAVVFTGTHPERFISHADVRWLQAGGARRSASAAPPPSHVRQRSQTEPASWIPWSVGPRSRERFSSTAFTPRFWG
jgi:enoyl-CoA hydratase/carnithine racemase